MAKTVFNSACAAASRITKVPYMEIVKNYRASNEQLKGQGDLAKAVIIARNKVKELTAKAPAEKKTTKKQRDPFFAAVAYGAKISGCPFNEIREHYRDSKEELGKGKRAYGVIKARDRFHELIAKVPVAAETETA